MLPASRLACALTMSACLVGACGGESADPKVPVAGSNDWTKHVELYEETTVRVGGALLTRKRYVVAADSPPGCPVTGITQPCDVPHAMVDGHPVFREDKAKSIAARGEPYFFFDELWQDGARVLERAPRTIEIVPGQGIFVQPNGLQIVEYAREAYHWNRQLGDKKHERFWALDGLFGEGRVSHAFKPYGKYDPATRSVAPSSVLVVEELRDGSNRRVQGRRTGTSAVVAFERDKYTLELFDKQGVRLGHYDDYVPRPGHRSGVLRAGKFSVLTVRTGGAEQDVVLGTSFLPLAVPEGRAIVVVNDEYGGIVTTPRALVHIGGTELYWPLDGGLPPGAVGVVPRNYHGAPLPPGYAVGCAPSFFVRYAPASGEGTAPGAPMWGVADPYASKVSPPKWAAIVWAPPVDHEKKDLYDWGEPLLLTRVATGWRAHKQYGRKKYEALLDEPAVGAGATPDEAIAGARRSFEHARAEHLGRVAAFNREQAAFWAAEAASAKRQREDTWREAVRLRKRDTVSSLVRLVDAPGKWDDYVSVLGEQADPTVLEDAARYASSPEERAKLVALAKTVREWRAQAEVRRRELEKQVIQANAPAPPPSGGGSWSPQPIKIDTSGYQNLVKENFERSQRGENPWGRSWSSP